MKAYPLILLFALITVCLLPVNVQAKDVNQEEINQLLSSDPPPFGVVFEVIQGDRSALDWAMPRVKVFAQQLREKFPDIGIAVVSHGKEEFALMTSKRDEHKEMHKTVQSLVKDDKIPVHVCGTHASWYGKKPEDFPDYVDVAPAGPTQISNYEDMGYHLIVLSKPK